MIREEILAEFASPAFLIAPPDIRHRDRIPPPIHQMMQGAWNRVWYEQRPVTIRALYGVFVAEEGLILSAEGNIELSSIGQHQREAVDSAVMSVQRAIEAASFTRLEGSVVLCRRPGTGNYGHWLVEMLPQAYFAAKHLPYAARYMVQAVGGNLKSVMRQTLGRIGVSDDMVVVAGREPVFVERLIVVDGLTDHGVYMSPLVFECLDRIAQSIAPGDCEKLYAGRGRVPTRALLNEAEFVDSASAGGFISITPGDMPFDKQVAAFKAARKVVGVIGANLANLVFTRPGAEVYILSPADMPDTFFWFICGLRKLRLLDIRCRQPPALRSLAWQSPLMIDKEDQRMILSSSGTGAPQSSMPLASPGCASLFNAAYYLAQFRCDMPAGCDPLDHYCTTGWQNGLDPSAMFSTARYLAAYPDVAQEGINPLIHFVRNGQAEGRMAFPAAL